MSHAYFRAMDTIDLSSKTEAQLLDLVEAILNELRFRRALLSVEDSNDVPNGPAPATASTNSAQPGLQTPYTCGFRCTHCHKGCTRAEPGHRHHRCWDHRRCRA